LLAFTNATPRIYAQNGSVIVIQTKGVVNAYSPQGRKLTSPVVRGSVLPVGYSIKTGFFSESILLFSNGTTATILENSKLRLDKFTQAPFDAQNGSFAQLQTEPSASQVSVNMDLGSLVVQTKKLKKGSSFSITTPVGTAGIRGTQFQLAMSPDSGMKLDVAESQVAFTPAGQAQPLVIGPGKGLDASASGNINQRSISTSAAQNINVKNSVATSASGAVPLATAKKSNKQAKKAAKDQEGEDSSGDGDSQTDESTEDPEKDKQASSDDSKDSDAAESFVGRSNSINKSNITAAEIIISNKITEELEKVKSQLVGKYGQEIANSIVEKLESNIQNNSNSLKELASGNIVQDLKNSDSSNDYEEIFKGIGLDLDILNESEMPPPPNIIPPEPPALLPGIGNSVRYSYDSSENLLAVGLYPDNFDIPIDVSYLKLDDVEDWDLNSLLGLLKDWDVSDETKLVHGLGLEVFIDEIGLNPAKYDNFNVAIQHATSLAQSFLETIILSSSMPNGKVRNAQSLVDEFANNPYAYEFAKLLAKHGAISNPSNQKATDNLIAILGSEKLSDANYLSTILGQTLIPGDSYNSQELNGGLIGARNASIDPKAAEQLQIRLQNVQALIGGDVFIESGASIDVSEYLTPKGLNEGTKIFTIAAAKDLSIWGDVTFKNDNHAEDHALSLGSAGNFNIQAGSKIIYEGSNLGIGTAGDLELIDIDIDVGGNLAIGSLGELNIKSTEPGSSLFSVGRYSDRDNIYLYANDLVQLEGLRFNERAREIYMEAITVNLKNIDFPEYSEVMLRSKTGTLDFDTFLNPTIGGVNLTNVKHLGISNTRALQQSDFTNSNGKWNSSVSQPSGTPAVKIRPFSTSNSSSNLN
jgi:hypothetical protein